MLDLCLDLPEPNYEKPTIPTSLENSHLQPQHFQKKSTFYSNDKNLACCELPPLTISYYQYKNMLVFVTTNHEITTSVYAEVTRRRFICGGAKITPGSTGATTMRFKHHSKTKLLVAGFGGATCNLMHQMVHRII